jgi:hypothetical protein
MLRSLRAAGAGDGAGGTGLAAAAAFHFVGAATWPAAFDERFGELAELDSGFVGFGELLGVGFELGRDIAQEIEKESLAVEQMFDIDEDRRMTHITEQRDARVVCLLAIFFQPSLQQIVLHGHAAENFTVGEGMALVAIIGWTEHIADFESAPRAYYDAAMTWIAYGIDGRETADLAHRTDTD